MSQANIIKQEELFSRQPTKVEGFHFKATRLRFNDLEKGIGEFRFGQVYYVHFCTNAQRKAIIYFLSLTINIGLISR